MAAVCSGHLQRLEKGMGQTALQGIAKDIWRGKRETAKLNHREASVLMECHSRVPGGNFFN